MFYVEAVAEVTEEFEAFDKFSLMGEVGGALGLLLGWSCLKLLSDLVEFVADKMASKGTKE